MVIMEQVYAPGKNANWTVYLYHRHYKVRDNKVDVYESDIDVMMSEGFRVVKEEPVIEEAPQLDTKSKKSRATSPKGK